MALILTVSHILTQRIFIGKVKTGYTVRNLVIDFIFVVVEFSVLGHIWHDVNLP